jgi:hypothetical protein
MQRVTNRAFLISLIAILSLLTLGIIHKSDVALSIAGIAIGLSGARAIEGSKSLSPRRKTEKRL